MGKFSKEYDENQIKKLKRCYINYNDIKEKIKYKYTELDQVQDKNKFIDKAASDFVSSLNIELKKVITSYNHQEKEINLIMNSLLHNKNNYNSYVLVQIQKEYQEIVNVSEITLHLVKFSYYNLLSLQKLLSKFDKKFCVDIKYNYIQSKIEEKGEKQRQDLEDNQANIENQIKTTTAVEGANVELVGAQGAAESDTSSSKM